VKKIILIDSKWDTGSAALQYALKASKNTDTEVAGVFLVSDNKKETVDKAGEILKSVKQKFASEGVGFNSYVVTPEPQEFMNKINGLMPASLVLVGSVSFSDEMKKGGVSVEALKKKLACPVTTADALAAAHAEKKHEKGTNWGMWSFYAICSALMYFLLYPNIRALNEKLFMTGTVLGAIATMGVVIVHAWVWGNTTHILPRLFRLEK